MENVYIEQKDDSPKIIMDKEKGLIEFEGECYPENTFDFFEPILEWLNNYFKEYSSKRTTVNIKLSYFNSSTTQILFDIFDIFDIFDENEFLSLNINWYYDQNNKGTLKDFEEFNEEFQNLNINAIAL